METLEELKEAHDKLLAEGPEDKKAEHLSKAAECPICKLDESPNKDSQEGVNMDKEFSKEDVALKVTEAVAAALAPVQKELEALKATAEEAETDSRITEIQEAAKLDVENAKNEVTLKVAELATLQSNYDELVAYLDKATTDAEAATLLETQKTERLDAIASIVELPEAHIAENAELWASMETAQFDTFLETLKVAAPAKEEIPEVDLDGKIASTAARNVRPIKPGSTDVKGSLGRLAEARNAGVKLGTLNK